MACDGHDGCGHVHGPNSGQQTRSLYRFIKHVHCLNESTEGTGCSVFKPLHEKDDRDEFVLSDCDPELLFNVAFTSNVKLTGFQVIGGEADDHPSEVKLYKNKESMTFDDVGADCDQRLELAHDPNGDISEYPVKAVKFNNVNKLALYFPKNYGADQTKIYFIALFGDFLSEYRREVVNVVYESTANPADHKTDTYTTMNFEIQ